MSMPKRSAPTPITRLPSEKQLAIANRAPVAVMRVAPQLTELSAALITQCPPRKAQGIEPTEMRAMGGTREPGALTRAQKIAEFKRLEPNLNPADRERARRVLGL